MAKLNAPLFSFRASGKLADALVFFGWKGINVVRQYVVPANPDTLAQGVQRDFLTDAVALIHQAQALANYPLASADQVAYAALAAAKGKIMTWFNMAVKICLDCEVNNEGCTIFSHGLIVDLDKGDFRPRIYFNDDGVLHIAAGTFYLGTTRTNLIQSIPANIESGVRADLADGTGFSGLTAGKKYFWQFRTDDPDPCTGADSGIYYAVAT